MHGGNLYLIQLFHNAYIEPDYALVDLNLHEFTRILSLDNLLAKNYKWYIDNKHRTLQDLQQIYSSHESISKATFLPILSVDSIDIEYPELFI